MKATEMHVIRDLNTRRAALGTSVRELADALCKDETTVRRQINTKDSTSVTLYIAYEYAQALGGAVMFLTDEQVETLKTATDTARLFADQEKRIAELTAENERLSASVAKQKGIVAAQEAKIERLESSIERKDAAIERKDAKIGELLARAGI